MPEFWVFFFSEILVATSTIRPRADVAYCLHALARRLAKTHNWTVLILLIFGFFIYIFCLGFDSGFSILFVGNAVGGMILGFLLCLFFS